MSSIRPSYFTVFSSIFSSEYLSLQYVNSINCTISVGLGWFGGSALYGWLRMHNMSGLSLALHWHLWVWLLQVHGSSQGGNVFSWICPSVFPAFIRVQQRDLVLDIKNLRISWTALLCRLMRSLCICGSVHATMCLAILFCIASN
jgi:hypothetical protein